MANLNDIYSHPHYTGHGLVWGAYYIKRDEIKQLYREGKISLEEFKRMIREEAWPIRRRAKELTILIAESITFL